MNSYENQILNKDFRLKLSVCDNGYGMDNN